MQDTKTSAQQIQKLFFGGQINLSSSISTSGDRRRRRHTQKKVLCKWNGKWTASTSVTWRNRKSRGRRKAKQSIEKCWRVSHPSGRGRGGRGSGYNLVWWTGVSSGGRLWRGWDDRLGSGRRMTEELEAMALRTVRARLIWMNPNWSFAYISRKNDSLVRGRAGVELRPGRKTDVLVFRGCVTCTARMDSLLSANQGVRIVKHCGWCEGPKIN